MKSELEKICAKRGLRMTGPRRVIMDTLAEASDHPDVEQLHKRVQKRDPKIGMATVYRTVKMLEECGAVCRHEFGDGRARYENAAGVHHDHLIDLENGKVIEFSSPEIEKIQKAIAEKLGYVLVGHRLELFCEPKKNAPKSKNRTKPRSLR